MIRFRCKLVFGCLAFFMCSVQLFLLDVQLARSEAQYDFPVISTISGVVGATLGQEDVGPTSVRSQEGRAALKTKTDTSSSEQPSAFAPSAPYPRAGGIARYAHAQCATQPDSFYVISGVSNGGVITDTYRYDADANSWTQLAPVPVGGEGPSATCYQGKIYVAGGSVSTHFFIYDIASDTWAAGPTLPRAVVGAAMGSYENKIFMAGGDTNFFPGDGISDQIDVFNVALNAWTGTGSPMPVGTVFSGYAQLGRHLYVVGGWGASSPAENVSTAQRYDMVTDTWTTGPSFISARADFPLAATSQRLYAMGGDANGVDFFDGSALVEYLDHTSWPSGTWTDASDPFSETLTAHGGGFCTNAVSGGEVWSTGGITAGFTFSSTNQYKTAEPCYREGALGTKITMIGSGFGDTKGKVLIGGLAQKVESWANTSITVTVKKPPLPGETTYGISIQPKPKGTPTIDFPGAFTVRKPEINVLTSSAHAAPGAESTINGMWFGTKKGKVYVGDQKCKVTSWTMNPATGVSTITFVVHKKIIAGTYLLEVENKVGRSLTFGFMVP